MKANELMIGDWIKTPHNNTAQIIEIVCEETENDKFEYFVELSDTFDFHISEIQPIPLTPELLKKNGFINEPKGVLYNYVLPKEKHLLVFECSVLEGTLFQTLVIKYQREFDYIKEYDVTEDVHIHIKYVHQLQHALKLCGIDKEIVL